MTCFSRFLSVAFSARLWAIGGLGLWLTACQSGSDKPAATSTAPAQPTSTSQLTDSPDTWYRQYRTLLPGTTDSITLHLQNFGSTSEEFLSGRIGGFYAAAEGRPVSLTGENYAASPDSLLLHESILPLSVEGDEGLVWRLKRMGTQLVGTRDGQAVRLRLVQPPAGVAFISRVFADSVPARPSQPTDTLFGRLRLHALVPVNGPAKQALQQHLLRGLRGDTLDTQPVPELSSLWQQQRSAFARDYQEEVGPLLNAAEADTSSNYRPLATLAYATETSTQVLWNQDNLLSIGYLSYSYSGGAHGNYGTTVCSYDTRTGRPLRYQDIFRPGSEAGIEKLLGQYARPVLGLKPGQPLSEVLFDNNLPATHNVYLTSGGAVFVYSPYEVASFAQGEISVFVPLSALKPWLQTGLPILGGGEVVRK